MLKHEPSSLRGAERRGNPDQAPAQTPFQRGRRKAPGVCGVPEGHVGTGLLRSARNDGCVDRRFAILVTRYEVSIASVYGAVGFSEAQAAGFINDFS